MVKKQRSLVVVCASAVCVLFLLKSAYADDAYAIQEGETIYQISKKYDIPVEILMSVNDIGDPTSLSVGSTIQIPVDIDTSNRGDISRNSSSRTWGTHIVQKGETLYGISQKYQSNMNAIITYNKMNNTELRIGQKIMVPQIKSNIDIITPATVVPKRVEVEKNIVAVSASAKAKESVPVVSIKQADPNYTRLIKPNYKVSRNAGTQWPTAGRIYSLEGKLPGIVIEGKEGQTVRAVSDGVVVYVAPHMSFQNVVMVQSLDNKVYVYGGQGEIRVKRGERIQKGMVLGEIGLVPYEKKYLLYFSIWERNRYIDPLQVLS